MHLTPADGAYVHSISSAVSELREELEIVQDLIRGAEPDSVMWKATLTHHLDTAAAIARDSASLHSVNPDLATLDSAFRSSMESYLVFCENIARAFAGGHYEELNNAEEAQNSANYHLGIVAECMREVARQFPSD